MPEYRRNHVEGGTYFFTVALADRRSDLLVKDVDALRASVLRARALYPFNIDAWVVLPEHLRAVWTLPGGDADFSVRWALIKRGFSVRLANGESRSASRIAKGERGVWQRRFWEHTIRCEADFRRHVDYVHFNPVKHGLVGNAGDWPFSSFRRAVARGDYPADWGGGRRWVADLVRDRTGDAG
ncbi:MULTISPECIES: REP-associated tyrosine transposase [Acidiphilium]|uniref:REP-associated tyrosine transposase n=1 Tax=Acidiphilium TaxID=522 RepID=UPI00068B4AD3|nr:MULTISPECIES: transposase [Acidiphilium]